MINKLKKKFTTLATASMLLLMTVLVLIMNIVNYSSIISDCNTILDILSKNEPASANDTAPQKKPGKKSENANGSVPHGMSPEVLYESRYFTVSVSDKGEIKESNLSKIISVDEDEAKEYFDKAMSSGKSQGFIGNFRFLKSDSNGRSKILFLDCGRKLDSFKTFLYTSIIVGLLGCIVVFVAFLFVSGKIVKPIAESYEKQKRFISDAGHEIKTPLTIISANADILECDGESEEIDEIKRQVGRLTTLTNNLVYLSKMEESEHKANRIQMSLSDLISECVNSFRAPASACGTELKQEIAADIIINAFPDDICRLADILLENAVKYSPENSVINITLGKDKKDAVLSVENSTKEKINSEDLPKVFDRFFRTDTSRNSETGGHGIGLSMAKAIVEAHSGTISASTGTGNDFKITVHLPLN